MASQADASTLSLVNGVLRVGGAPGVGGGGAGLLPSSTTAAPTYLCCLRAARRGHHGGAPGAGTATACVRGAGGGWCQGWWTRLEGLRGRCDALATLGALTFSHPACPRMAVHRAPPFPV